ncbi:nitrilase-related carbon-nitrogen hydrolase [Zestomonas carbonaria]|uniref:(R)-stereoselective amidase n=1 Tax=Zestomonas carbonaria TaxID=2762745 RepID=A0A7U7I9G4_9GAMM|nr:nitrilase-related carbon-nitrogen hydrolase [Pseudomonas carbonaria]CAD5108265.1 (R)-stereoselective amidase [Pseudomonas carbonaria]
MTTIRVAAAQIPVRLGGIDDNLETHRRLARQALQDGAEVLLFPELSLTGYQLGRQVPTLAMTAGDERLRTFAREFPDLLIVCGFVERASPGEFYNAMVWLRGGEPCFVHRKLNLPTYGGLEEGKLFTAADHLALCDAKPGWPTATLICADLWNPGLVHAAMLRRPSLLLAPINSAEGVVSAAFSNPDGWALNLRFYAMTYGIPLVMANRCDSEQGTVFWGGSRILGPRGETLAQAGGDEQLICSELELEAIAQARFDLPTIRDANTPLVRSLL